MSARVHAATVLAALAIAAGCGDLYVELPSDASDVASDAGSLMPAVAEERVVCPTDRPRENSPCSVVGSTCEYGKSADQQCNVVLTCRGSPSAGYWDPSQNQDGCAAKACPVAAEIATLDGRPCSLPQPDGGVATDADEAICNVSDGVCACTTGPSGAALHPRTWTCVRPVAMCPTSRPLAGHPCSGGLWCDYGSCDFKRGVLMECKNETWRAGGQTCP